MIAAAASGSGKTVVTCGLLQLLKQKGRPLTAFKCGPDYIDGLFHRRVLGVETGNLDSFFSGPESLRALYARESAGRLAVVEGVMGYFDGLGGSSTAASSWEVAQILGLPVLLVVDARGASVSLAALVSGFLHYGGGNGNGIAGVILNRMTPMLYPRIKELIERECAVPVLGYVPPLDFLRLESRHLGLVLPDEVEGLRGQLDRLAAVLEETLDWEQIEALAGGTPEYGSGTAEAAPGVPEAALAKPAAAAPFRLAVAWDEAFCFYYRENFRLLERLGAELAFFSPLHDRALPPGASGLLLGGGYPEHYAAALSANTAMRRAVLQAAESGLPLLAECGGYLYLLHELEGEDGGLYPMAGVLDGRGLRRGKNSHFGYITVEAGADGPYLRAGESVRGHEFHHWGCAQDDRLGMLRAVKPAGGRSWPCMRIEGRVMAGFPHLYYPSCPQLAGRFAAACRAFDEEQKVARAAEKGRAG